MYILGLHGWSRREHDPSACLIKDGKIIAMAEEERFIRQKYAFDHLPINAIKFCLNQAKINLNQVDLVTLGYDRKKLCQLRGIDFNLNNQKIQKILLPKKYFNYSKYPNFEMVDHHLSHAASAYFTSGFNEAAVLVIDGQGEDCSTSLGYAKDGKINIFRKISIPNSLGYLYESVSKFIGFGLHGAGKVMGLAAYGDSSKYKFDNLKTNSKGYQISFATPIHLFANNKEEDIDEQQVIVHAWFGYLERKYKIKSQKTNYPYNLSAARVPKETLKLTKESKDLAASMQRRIEDTILHLCRVLKKETKSDNLVISGGVGLNCSANGKINNSGIFKNVYIFPVANDAGVSLGSALKKYYDLNKYRPREIKTVYWGPNFTNVMVRQILDDYGLEYDYHENIERITANLISQRKIIGWFQGRMEVGPRALGNRSILADPRKRKNHNFVNAIKGRENWRPLSPSILEGFENKYFEKSCYSPFMLKSFIVRKDCIDKIPAVVHFDETARPQSVSKSTNRRFYNLINEFYKITKIPILLNTSFNGRGEPIVCSPLDAIKMFCSSRLDCLVINNFLIKKKG